MGSPCICSAAPGQCRRSPCAQVNRLKGKIDEQYNRVNEIKDLIEGKKNSKDGISSQGQAHKDKIAKLRAEFNVLLVGWPPRPRAWRAQTAHRLS